MRTSSIDRTAIAAANSAASSASTAAVAAQAAAADAAAVAGAVIDVDEAAASAASAAAAVDVATTAAATAATAATDAAASAGAASGAAATTDSVMAARVEDSGSELRGALNAAFAGATVLAGTGIDPTGAADSTTAVQAKLTAAAATGADVFVPPGIFKLTDSLTVAGSSRIFGPGELRWTSGIAGKDAITVTGDGAHLDGLRLTNPNLLRDNAGATYNVGIRIMADDAKVTDCTLDSFQHGIAVDMTGEYVGYIITGNHVLNVTGSGGGSGDATDIGEDRGDGITTWGGRGLIANNVVTAKAGYDPRVGIHAEGLAAQEVTPVADSNALTTIVGNVVSGPFRRGIVAEGVSHVTITGNTVTDSTWWGIAIIGPGDAVTCDGNTVRWTRDSSDTQGSYYSPVRAPLCVFNALRNSKVSGNTVVFENGSSGQAGIVVVCPDGSNQSSNIDLENNTVAFLGTGTASQGILFSGAGATQDARVVGNVIRAGFTAHGINVDAAGDKVLVAHNTVRGGDGAVTGLSVSTAAKPRIVGNDVTDCQLGLACFNNSAGVVVQGNAFTGGVTGADFYGTTNAWIVDNNLSGNSTAALANAADPATGTITGNRAA